MDLARLERRIAPRAGENDANNRRSFISMHGGNLSAARVHRTPERLILQASLLHHSLRQLCSGNAKTIQTVLARLMAFPPDIKRDIATVIRLIEWVGAPGGTCFFRAQTGLIALKMLEIPADIELGGMIYRAGPRRCDMVKSCCPDVLVDRDRLAGR